MIRRVNVPTTPDLHVVTTHQVECSYFLCFVLIHRLIDVAAVENVTVTYMLPLGLVPLTGPVDRAFLDVTEKIVRRKQQSVEETLSDVFLCSINQDQKSAQW